LFALGAVNVQLRQKGRRRAQRYALNWEARITINAPAGETTALSGIVRDLSSTGVFIYINQSVQLDETVAVSIRLPLQKETWMNLRGTVVRVATHPQRSGVAIQFNQIRPKFISP